MTHPGYRRRSGPAVARLFQRLLALTFAVAWLSLGSQVLLLVGSHGLLPAAPWLAALRSHGIGWTDAPTWLFVTASDAALRAGIWIGVVLAALAAFGIRPRLCFALSTALYLGYAVACRSFLSFQWDNLLLECGALAAFLPARRRSRWIHVLFRLLLFKLYFESGIAKLESPIGDWLDGSAMRFYYETAPIPTALAYFFHALPAWWHHIESNATLLWEIGVPFLIWGPRRARLVALAVFSFFQIVNIATANYGFFSYLALFMGVFLLDDGDVWRMRHVLAARLPKRVAAWLRLAKWELRHVRAIANFRPRLPVKPRRVLRCTLASVVTAAWIAVGFDSGLRTFAHQRLGVLDELADAEAPFRLVNDYHLFMQVTRQRIEPTFETRSNGSWTELVMYDKPGPVDRAPPFVAPHQPRVDFLLWFYGLSFRRGIPPYVDSLIDHLCREPSAVQGLFTGDLPESPDAVRIVFYDYHFAPRGSKDWWTRREVARTRALSCR